MLWVLDTGIDCGAATQSIPVSKTHSRADYLNFVPDYFSCSWGVPAGGQITRAR
jgi:hypothetical protein